MTCREAIYSESVLDYIVGAYRGMEYITERYDPICITEIDPYRAAIYKEADKINSDSINALGYGAIPHVYGLMADEALEASGVSKIRRQPYLDLYGQNMLVGVVDTGIDFTHRAFLNADNTTRILSIWDQTIREGGDAEGFQYGREFSREEINAALADEDPFSMIPTRDDYGHGTFLAGIAAGNEMREDEFSGVAPLSEIVVVKCKEAKNSYREFYRVPREAPCFQENDFVNAVPGVCVIACAGNEGDARHHYYLTKEYEEIDINVEKATQGFVCELWWRTPGRLEFDVVSPSGATLGVTRAAAYTKVRKRFTVEDTTVEALGGEMQEQTRDLVVMFRFENSKAGVWKILVTSSEPDVKYHMWLPIRQFLSADTYFVRPDPNVTICEPGNSRKSTTVSAYNPSDGAFYIQASRGFTQTGVIKPDVTAPGVGIYGPLPKNNFGTMTGTGIAAALTTGIAALFMQEYSDYIISGYSVRELLIRGAERRGDEYPNREWGYGTVDAYNSLTFE